ncbi:hypothetical protein EKO04_011412 [Ascochyta lentis]|uniref:Uncharacterized protein n=1 Tax=Ascochyta lentis TaxID=205686 RepID=A0A8H7IUV9_9PLEO|nr:hypothetical protein EKO04_011412 [Ascochyta lentis]
MRPFLCRTDEQFLDYFAFITTLPLREAFAPPVFDHPAVLAPWKDAFALVLAHCEDEEVAGLTRSATKIEIGNLVQHRAADLSWTVVFKPCKHVAGPEEMCTRCGKELEIARRAIIENANLSARDALGTETWDHTDAMIWALIAENGSCKVCHERNYVACLCDSGYKHRSKATGILWEWSKKNKALSIDMHYRDRYLDFMMRHVEYESCLVCPKNRHNIELPFSKRLCLCKLSERSICIFDTLKNDPNIDLAAIDVATTYAMIRYMLRTFVFHIVKDDAVVSQV